MKKSISLFLALILCAVPVFLLSSCGKKGDASSAEFEKIVENVGNKFGELNEEDIKTFEVAGSDDKGDNVIYNDEKINTGFILDKGSESIAHTRYTILDAIYKDVDGDGRDEVFTMGVSEKNGQLTVDYFDYVKTFFDEKTEMREIASASFDSTLCLGFSDDKDGTVHLIQYTDGTKNTVKEDMGSISVNGVKLDIGKTGVSAFAAKPDMSIFPDMKDYVYTFNGKEYKPAADFCYKPGDSLDIYFSCEEIEKVTGQKPKDFSGEENLMAFMTIYGKKYVHFTAIPLCYDNLKMELGKDSVLVALSTKDYVPATTVAAETK